jgi:hypothetical protein
MEFSAQHPLVNEKTTQTQACIPVYMPGGSSRVVVGYAVINSDGLITIKMHDIEDSSKVVQMLSDDMLKGVSFDYREATAKED